MKKILVVGITPPPYGGQAMMTERLINADFDNIELYHVRMSFSKSMSSVGNFELGKVFHMIEVVIKAIFFRFRYNISVLYYMPGGSNLTPVLRDIFILFFLRMAFSKVIFHFRAAGISEIVQNQGYLIKKLAKFVYNKANVAIQLSELNPPDGAYFNAKKTIILPNGLEDAAEGFLPIVREEDDSPVNILFVGVIQESKGVSVLLEATKKLAEEGCQIQVNFVGDFASDDYKRIVLDYIRAHELEEFVHFAGVKKGDEKWKYFLDSDIFCFPSFFEAESFGNVVVEAMMFELPVVASKWRGIPSIVEDGKTGFLVEPKNSTQTAEKLKKLIDN